MDKLVSLIVPVYNVEKYISTCIESILCQTYHNLQIILVDDGATDSSGRICDEYAKKDSRIQVIHKKNGGLSDARNAGIPYAKGEYILFIDSDDVISSNNVEHLLNLVEEENADIGICDLLHVYSGEDIVYKQEKKRTVMNAEEANIEMLYQNSFLVSACAKIFKKELFQEIRFPVGMLFEDSATIYKVLDKAEKIVYSDARLYGYMHRENSITTKKFSKRDCDILKICQEIVDYMSDRSEALQKAARCYQVVGALRIYLNAPRENQFVEEIEYCQKLIKNNGKSVLLDKFVRKKTRLALILFFFARPLMPWAYSKVDRWR